VTDLQTSTPTPSTSYGDDLGHWLCCHDSTRTLCGAMTTEPPSDDAEPDCIVCDDLDWSDTCPLFGPNGCRGSEDRP
jgi:hypothetical protein